MGKTIFALLLVAMTLRAIAQETVYQINEVSAINYGDGRLLFRQINEAKTPLDGSHRIIDGYRSEYILAEFKNGMYNGAFQHFKNNRLKEEGTYKEGRKDGVYKEYYSDGVTVKSETPFTGGKINGIRKNYFTNGKIEKEKGYKMSVEDGIERITNWETGNVTALNYKDGRKHGSQVAYISSNIGNWVEHSNYDMGKPVGEFTETFSDGTVKTIGRYNNDGKKDGEWLVRDSFAEKAKFAGQRIVYKNGEVMEKEDIKDFQKFEKKKLK